MGIDYVINYDCEPKQALTLEGLLGRLKGRDRAQAIIQFYRDQGDERSPAKIGFEMVHRSSDGNEEIDLVIAQDLLDLAEELTPWESHCARCPANRAGMPFGCIGHINYSISLDAELWLLDQLPDNTHPLPHMLLQKAVHEMGYTGEAAARLRAQEGVFLESTSAPEREFDGFSISGDQVFELLFLSGPIGPAHGSMLLQFFGGISRDLDPNTIMQLAAPPSQAWIDTHTPFLLTYSASDADSITTLKAFLQTLHIAYRLSMSVLLDV